MLASPLTLQRFPLAFWRLQRPSFTSTFWLTSEKRVFSKSFVKRLWRVFCTHSRIMMQTFCNVSKEHLWAPVLDFLMQFMSRLFPLFTATRTRAQTKKNIKASSHKKRPREHIWYNFTYDIALWEKILHYELHKMLSIAYKMSKRAPIFWRKLAKKLEFCLSKISTRMVLVKVYVKMFQKCHFSGQSDAYFRQFSCLENTILT